MSHSHINSIFLISITLTLLPQNISQRRILSNESTNLLECNPSLLQTIIAKPSLSTPTSFSNFKSSTCPELRQSCCSRKELFELSSQIANKGFKLDSFFASFVNIVEWVIFSSDSDINKFIRVADKFHCISDEGPTLLDSRHILIELNQDLEESFHKLKDYLLGGATSLLCNTCDPENSNMFERPQIQEYNVPKNRKSLFKRKNELTVPKPDQNHKCHNHEWKNLKPDHIHHAKIKDFHFNQKKPSVLINSETCTQMTQEAIDRKIFNFLIISYYLNTFVQTLGCIYDQPNLHLRPIINQSEIEHLSSLIKRCSSENLWTEFAECTNLCKEFSSINRNLLEHMTFPITYVDNIIQDLGSNMIDEEDFFDQTIKSRKTLNMIHPDIKIHVQSPEKTQRIRPNESINIDMGSMISNNSVISSGSVDDLKIKEEKISSSFTNLEEMARKSNFDSQKNPSRLSFQNKDYMYHPQELENQSQSSAHESIQFFYFLGINKNEKNQDQEIQFKFVKNSGMIINNFHSYKEEVMTRRKSFFIPSAFISVFFVFLF